MNQSGVRSYPLDFFLEPMKPARPGNSASAKKKLLEALQSPDYIAEEKIDGCHYFSIGGRIFSPRVSVKDGIPVEKTLQVPHLASLLNELFGNLTILDGECHVNGGKAPDVVSIMGSEPGEAVRKQTNQGLIRYMIFDILRDHTGKWLIDLPWYKRRRILEQYYKEAGLDEGSFVTLVNVCHENKQAYLDFLLSQGKEGVVLKHISRSYVLGKRPAWNWIKIKTETEDDVVIIGFEPPERVYTGKNIENWPYWDEDGTPVTRYWYNKWIGAIVFGKYNKAGELVRLGTCSGMSDAEREKFSKHPEQYIGRVIKVKLMEYTRDGAYRHCSFVALHPDKNAHECRLEE
ncbi:MAG TPA: hypothetical protein PLN81_05245 [Bacillota bacterium]|nr:hypothetical protein [Bacillota bacterium]